MSGTNNFLQFNPPATNQENDASYAADSLRSGGIPTNAIFPSPLANKLFYQLSIFVAAFAQMMADKGYNLSDSDFNTLKAILANVLTNADTVLYALIPYSLSPTFNAAAGAKNRITFEIILTGNVTSSTLVNVAAGQEVVFIIRQDATGGRTFSWPVQIAGLVGPVDPTPSTKSTQSFIVGGDGSLYPLSPMSVS